MHFNNKYEPWMDQVALDGFKEGESIESICCMLDIHPDTFYAWRANSEHPFSAVAKKGKLLAQQYWERIGKKGIIGEIEKFSGSSWQFTMKNRFRESYSDQAQKDIKDTLIEKLLEKV